MKFSKLSPLPVLASVLALCSASVSPGHVRSIPTLLHLPAVAIPADVGDLGQTESLFLFTAYEQFDQLFGDGASAAAGIDFKSQWAFFYSAGLLPTGGYEALVEDITYTADVQSLVITTQLLSPGENCGVPQMITKPNILVKFPKPPGEVGMVRLQKDDQTVDCIDN
jgi:PrcB C-terminal